LVELLAAIAIIAVLVAITVPAVQAAREAARKASCQNNLRQLGVALESQHGAIGHYPTNGWGYRWLGQPKHDWGDYHPGGWIYNSLGYLEQEPLRRLGAGSGSTKDAELTQLMQTPLAVLHCPSRRAARLYPYLGRFPLFNAPRPEFAAKCDYAGNGGDLEQPNSPGPPDLTPAAVRAYSWPDTSELTGVFFVRSRIGTSDIVDGTSQTYLVGEKHVSTVAHEESNRDIGDDQTCYIGDDTDIRRWTAEPPRRDSQGHASTSFGSAHSAGCFFVFCDGSVRLVRYGIDPDLHRRLGNRHDRQTIKMDEL
jgi:hypothetical protein